MDPADKRSALLRLARLEARLTALRLRLMAASDDVALAEGARDVAALMAPPHARRLQRRTGATWRSLRRWIGAGPVWPPALLPAT